MSLGIGGSGRRQEWALALNASRRAPCDRRVNKIASITPNKSSSVASALATATLHTPLLHPLSSSSPTASTTRRPPPPLPIFPPHRAMSLPTPPGTSHRDEKENRAPRFSRVSWSDTTELYPITGSPPRTTSARSSASKPRPSRSILKKTTHRVLPSIDEDAIQKESTPEPEDPLVDLHYLDNPVARIVAPDASLCDLIQAYTSLMARLRNCIAGNTDADASWPLFQPIRKNRKTFVEALVRDLQQVFVDPLEGVSSTSAFDPPSSPLREPPSTTSLPSPRDSPKKTKKRGMSEEQVKRARDLCGLCHAVMRLLSVVFTIPSLYNLFDGE